MERGLFIAASGMLAAQVRQDVIANNLANATTPGFKGDVVVQHAFGDLLLKDALTGDPVGPLTEGTQVDRVVVDSRGGSLRNTQNPLDLAISGDGWFSVQTQGGVAYTRNGTFTTNSQGQIVTAQGEPVLGTDGRPIVVDTRQTIAIARDGRVLSGTTQVGQLAVTALRDGSLRKMGDNLVSGTPDPQAPVGLVAQGYLETSNVNSVKQMVELIVNMRTFEAGQKTIRALDDTLDRAANQVGKA